MKAAVFCRFPGLQDQLKRALDVAASAVLLLILSPIFVLLALLVRLSSPGPVFYRQWRVGWQGRLFCLYKFRSMGIGITGPGVTARSDGRVTRIGGVLRRWKLDELPQLWNVLKGEMSLVGPRPEVPEYVRRYTAEQREVLAVRPGLTGVSQLAFRDEEILLAGQEDIESYYLKTIMPAKLALDRRYIRSRSLPGDFRIMIQTAAAVLRRGR